MYGLKNKDSVILPIDRDETTIGRHTNNNIVINAMPVSRHHSAIVKIDGRFFIKDKNTVNGTYIKRHRLIPNRETLLTVGDKIGIGCKSDENDACTFEVVMIQHDTQSLSKSNETLEESVNNDEIRNVVDSTTDNTHKNEEESKISESRSKSRPVHKNDEESKISESHSKSKPVHKNDEESKISESHLKSRPVKEEPTCSRSPKKPEPNSITNIFPIDGSSPSSSASKRTSEQYFKTCDLNEEESEDDDVIINENLPQNKVQISTRYVNLDDCNDSDKSVECITGNYISGDPIDLDSPPNNELECINLIESSDEGEEVDFKPLFKSRTDYSMLDEVVILDSDEEDFPCSQLNVTQVCDIPDYSSSFRALYDEDELDSKDKLESILCHKDMWFEPLSQTNIDGKSGGVKKLVVDLPSDDIPDEYHNQTNVDEEFSSIYEKKKSVCVSSLSEKENYCSQDEKKANDEVPEGELRECYVVLPPLVEECGKKRKSIHSEESLSKKKIIEISNDELYKNKIQKLKKKKKRKYEHEVDGAKDGVPKSISRELRKEKLKKLAMSKCESNSTSFKTPRQEPISGPVAVKVTKKNRGSFLIDSLCNDSVKPTMKSINISSNRSAGRSGDSDRKASCVNKPMVEPLKSKAKPEDYCDSYMTDILGIDSERFDLPADTPNVSKLKGDTSTKDENSFNEIKNPVKRIAHTKTKSMNKCKTDSKILKNEVSSNLKNYNNDENIDYMKKNYAGLMKKGEVQSDVSHSIQKANKFGVENSGKYHNPIPEIGRCGINEEKKSNLKKKSFYYAEHGEKNIKKRVNFCILHDYQLFESDPEERRNNGMFAPCYKLSESLIRDELTEFENAIATVCKWNVKWLEEQQKTVLPPPHLYKIENYYPEKLMSLGLHTEKLKAEYKEKLKVEMFSNLWKAIFDSWNRPNYDFLPHTQFYNQNDISGLFTLSLESVDDGSRLAPLWTVVAFRDVSEYAIKEDLINGQIVIMSFYVKQKNNKSRHKSMSFAYIASVNDITLSGGRRRQRVVLKIFQKNFEILKEEVKIKVLMYTKTQLRPFQALAMIMKSPITNLITEPISSNFESPKMLQENFLDTFLDSSQKKAIETCLNCVLSPQPSVCIINGAPGTGKSQTIVSLIHELFSKAKRDLFSYDLKVLVITSSDNIADDVAYRLEKLDRNNLSSFNLIRYGNCKRVHHKIKYCTLNDRIQKLIDEDDGTSLINLEEEMRNLMAKKNAVDLVLQSASATEGKRAEARLKLNAWNREYEDLLRNDSRIKAQLQGQAAKEKVIENAGVVLTSVHTCWTSSFETDFVPSQFNKGDVHKFSVCIFDDANYLDETSMLIPIMLMVQTLILVGDSKNVFHFKDKNQSPFLRLVRDFEKKAPTNIIKLNTQHRMNFGISQCFSEYYKLNFKTKLPSRSALVPMLLINLKSSHEIVESDKWQKQTEFCGCLLKTIMEIEKNDSTTIAIIVVTEEQRVALRETLQLLKLDRAHKIRVDTLEEIAGRENEIIVLCIPSGNYQFDGWLYVASTRARSSLIICGYLDDIKNHSSIRWLLSYTTMKKMYSEWSVSDKNFPPEILRVDSRVR